MGVRFNRLLIVIILLIFAASLTYGAIVFPGCHGQNRDSELCLERDILAVQQPIGEFLKPLEIEGQTYAHIYGDKKLALAGALDTDVQAEALVGEAKGYLEIAQVKRNYEFIFVPSEEKEENSRE